MNHGHMLKINFVNTVNFYFVRYYSKSNLNLKLKPNLNPNLKLEMNAKAKLYHLPKQWLYLLLQHFQQHSMSTICSGTFDGSKYVLFLDVVSNEVKINSDYEVSA